MDILNGILEAAAMLGIGLAIAFGILLVAVLINSLYVPRR